MTDAACLSGRNGAGPDQAEAAALWLDRAQSEEQTAAPDEFMLIESTNPKVMGYDGATLGFVDFLYRLASAK